MNNKFMTGKISLIIMRLLANIIDLLVFFIIIVGAFVFVVPAVMHIGEGDELSIFYAIVIMIAVIVAVTLLQLPFLANAQTIGKAFLGLKIVTTDPERPITTGVILQREIFTKVFPLYFLCIPVLFGKKGQHDVAFKTDIERVKIERKSDNSKF